MESLEGVRMRKGRGQCAMKNESLMLVRERQMNFGQHLEELRAEDRFLVLPMMIKTVRIEHSGPIREFSAEFSEGVNIVYGPNGCGKTVLVKTLYDFFSSERGGLRYRLTHGKSEGRVSVVPYLPQTTFSYTEIRSAEGAWTPDAKRCALLDEPAVALAQDDFRQFLGYVKNLFAQVIITTHSIDRCSLGGGRLLKMRGSYGHEN